MICHKHFLPLLCSSGLRLLAFNLRSLQRPLHKMIWSVVLFVMILWSPPFQRLLPRMLRLGNVWMLQRSFGCCVALTFTPLR